MEVSFNPGEFVLDGNPAPPQTVGEAPYLLLRVEVENFEIGPEVWAFSVIANFVALNGR